MVKLVLRSLNAQALSRIAMTCKALATTASSDALWQRLYCARWGSFRGDEQYAGDVPFWKVRHVWLYCNTELPNYCAECGKVGSIRCMSRMHTCGVEHCEKQSAV